MRVPSDLNDGAEFCAKLVAVYGAEDAAAIVQRLGEQSARCYWINPLVAGEFAPVGRRLTDRLWVLPVDVRPGDLAAAANGRIYLQNPSSCFAAQVVAPGRDEEVLDLAAAPGGKTIAMAAMMDNSGRIAAVEPVKARFHRLRANLQRCGVTNAQLYQRDGRGVGRAVGERFDRVLLDAPCSSEARMRWSDPGSYRHWSLRKVKEAQRKQKSLLRSAYDALKPGGSLVYATCSFAPEENEAVVLHLLQRTNAELVPIEGAPPNSRPGLVRWRNKGSRDLAHCVRVLPDGIWDGFFVARLVKPG